MSKAAVATATAPAADAPAPKGKKKLLPIILAAVVLAGGGGGAWWYLGKKPADAAPKAEAPKPPQFVTMEAFTVNLKEDGTTDHFLQTGLTFQVAGPEVGDAIKLHQPVIRGRILLLLSSKSATELATLEAKNKLAEEILAAARAPLPGADPKKGILAVHFASFIIQ